MKWQAWRRSVVGGFASLGLMVCTGAGAARASDAPQAEPYFDPGTGAEGVATVAPQSEPYFELGTGATEGVAAFAPQSEPSFDIGTEATGALTAVAPQSEPQSAQTAQLQEKH
jgi:hypothetical protein